MKKVAIFTGQEDLPEYVVEFTDEEYQQVEKAATAAGLSVQQWIIKSLNSGVQQASALVAKAKRTGRIGES